MQSDLCISGTSSQLTRQYQTPQNNSNANKKSTSSTPLLDNAQIDSDYDTLETPRKNRMSIDENRP